MMCKRYGTIDGLRAFSALGIVMMHVQANGKYDIPGFIGHRMIPSFTDFVFLFMTVSAFGLCCGYYERFQNESINLEKFYKKRFMRILPFFALLSVLDVMISPSVPSLYELFANVTLMFGLLPNANITVIGVGWFLGVVFAFYLLFPFFAVLMKTKRRAWVALAIFVILNILCSVYFFNSEHVIETFTPRINIVYCFIYFIAGGLIYLYRDTLERLNVWGATIISLAAIVVYYIIGANALTCLAVSAALLILAITASKPQKSIIGGVLENRATAFLGGISMEVYLCHMVFYRIIEKIGFERIFFDDILSYVLTTIITLTFSILFSYIMKRIINKAMIYIIGGR